MKQQIKRRKLYSIVMNCTAPVLAVIFVAGSLCLVSEAQYSYTGEYETVDVMAEESNMKSVSYEYEAVDFSSLDSENTDGELVEACGIYIEDEFIGAVSDGGAVEDTLTEVLDEYLEKENILQADFAVETDIKQGLYHAEAVMDENQMTDFLTGEKRIVSEYTASENDTAEKIAESFDMTTDEIMELNPDLEKINDGEQLLVKETVSVLPVKYICQVMEEEMIELNEDDSENSSKGKKLNTYEITYVDGDEISRKLTETETIPLPDEETVSSAEPQQIVKAVTESVSEIKEENNIDDADFIWPVNGGYISDPFVSNRNHKGLDIAAPAGTDIYAAGDGVVLESGWNTGGYGYYVKIDHGNGYVTLYAHASSLFVSAGEKVQKGQLIAAVGTTGDSTGNHCHFEVIYGGKYLNPQNFI